MNIIIKSLESGIIVLLRLFLCLKGGRRVPKDIKKKSIALEHLRQNGTTRTTERVNFFQKIYFFSDSDCPFLTHSKLPLYWGGESYVYFIEIST